MKEKIKRICRVIILIGILFPLFSFAQNTNNEIAGKLAIPGTLRDCPSTDCKIIRYYAETAEVKIVGLDDSNKWYQVIANDDYGNKLNGWMHYSVFVDDYRTRLKNEKDGKSETIFIFGQNSKEITLSNEKQLYCTPSSFITQPLKPTENTKAMVLYQIKNPAGTWFRIAIDKEPIIKDVNTIYSGYCALEPTKDEIGFKYWVKEWSIPEDIRLQILDMEQFSKDTLELQSFRVDGNYIKEKVKMCPSNDCETEWMVGNGGIATIIEKEGDWFRIALSNFDTSHIDLFGGEGWVYTSSVPENVKTYFNSQLQNQGTTAKETTSAFAQKEESKSRAVTFLSFLKNKNFQIGLGATIFFIVFFIIFSLLRKRIKITLKPKGKDIVLESKKIAINWKGIIIAILILIVIIGTGFGVMAYQKISNSFKIAGELVKEEKYDEAITQLESIQNNWLIKLGFKKQEISNEIEKNKKLAEDKSEYTQGMKEFNQGNWEEAKELLSKVSEESPYYQDAKSKIDEAQNNIVKKQIEEAVEKVTKETEAAKKQAAELEQKIVELQQKQQSSGEPVISTSLSSSEINKIISSVVYVLCSGDYYTLTIKGGSGTTWQFSDASGYFVFTNAHIVSTIDNSPVVCLVSFPTLPSGTPYYLYKTTFYELGYSGGIDWALLKLTTPYESKYTLNQIPLFSDYPQCKFSDVNIGDKVTIFGYPAVGGNNITVTEGNISGFSGNDFKVSSGVIDKGNSGGAAILNKYKCSLGIPTWVSIGEASSVGIIQSWRTIYNDLSK